MAIHTYGPNAVDWERRVDLDRLRGERLARLKAQLQASSLGAVLSFDFGNIRYMTATHIGTWGMDKLIRFALLPRGGEPVVWDFGSAARHHQIYNPWLDHTGAPATPEGARRTGARAGKENLKQLQRIRRKTSHRAGEIQPPGAPEPFSVARGDGFARFFESRQPLRARSRVMQPQIFDVQHVVCVPLQNPHRFAERGSMRAGKNALANPAAEMIGPAASDEMQEPAPAVPDGSMDHVAEGLIVRAPDVFQHAHGNESVALAGDVAVI